jgi:dCTP diphosphatase
MADGQTTVGELKEAVRRFTADRNWEPYHAPKNLVMALAVEAAELMEPFLWVDAEASRSLGGDPVRHAAIADELADVFNLLLNLSLSLDVDLSAALRTKMVKNAEKYPPPPAGA